MARRRLRPAIKPTRPVALVTGAANGIGRAISHHLLDAGWCVLAVDLPKTRLIHHFRGWARSSATMEGDVSDEEVVREAVRFALDRFGRLDAVVANAGVFIRRPLRRLSLEDWRRVLDINLTSTFLLARASQRALRSSKGSIVTIASTQRADVGAQHQILLGLKRRTAGAHARARHQPWPRHPGQLRKPRAGSPPATTPNSNAATTPSILPAGPGNPRTSHRLWRFCSTARNPASSPAPISWWTAA